MRDKLDGARDVIVACDFAYVADLTAAFGIKGRCVKYNYCTFVRACKFSSFTVFYNSLDFSLFFLT